MSDTVTIRTQIKTPSEAIKFLKKAGTKVALQICPEDHWIFAEKLDFIALLKTGDRFTDYDDSAMYPVSIYIFVENNVLHVPHHSGGVSLALD